ncbi:MAG: membrane protease YdiL (CAAX protease family) [Myxococcota bacterium]|jgi:membrane protease YdiL (CAAX protease family)
MTSSPSKSDPKGADFRATFIILSSLGLFTVFWYKGRKAFFVDNLTGVFPDTELSPLYPFFYFCVMSVVLRMLIPIALIKLVLKRPLNDMGYRMRGARQTGRIYLALFLAMLPLVVYASTTAPFQAYYPQFKEVIVNGQVYWEHLLAFELVYGLLFLSGESFWRGYMLFGLEERYGMHAIPIMLLPYVMSHYEKPFMESLGAIVAGSVLGYLALKHRNFWLGVLVHWGVAMFMDLMALYQLGIDIV